MSQNDNRNALTARSRPMRTRTARILNNTREPIRRGKFVYKILRTIHARYARSRRAFVVRGHRAHHTHNTRSGNVQRAPTHIRRSSAHNVDATHVHTATAAVDERTAAACVVVYKGTRKVHLMILITNAHSSICTVRTNMLHDTHTHSRHISNIQQVRVHIVLVCST